MSERQLSWGDYAQDAWFGCNATVIWAHLILQGEGRVTEGVGDVACVASQLAICEGDFRDRRVVGAGRGGGGGCLRPKTMSTDDIAKVAMMAMMSMFEFCMGNIFYRTLSFCFTELINAMMKENSGLAFIGIVSERVTYV